MDVQLLGLIFFCWVLFFGAVFYSKFRHRYRLRAHALGFSPAILRALDAEGIGPADLPPELAPAPRHPETFARGGSQEGLEVVFVTAQNEERPVIFRCRPFGVRFEKRSPIRIDSTVADGPAEAFGIQRGWRVRRVGGEHVEDWTYQQVSQALRAHSAFLPEARSSVFPRPEAFLQEWTPRQIPRRTLRWLRSHVPQFEAALYCWRASWVSTCSLTLFGATSSWFTGAATESYSQATVVSGLEVFSQVHGSLLLLFMCLLGFRASSWLGRRSASMRLVRSFQGCLEDVALLVGSTVGPHRHSPEVCEALHAIHRYLTVLHVAAYARLQHPGRPFSAEHDPRHKLLLPNELKALERAPNEDGAVLLWATHLLSQLSTAEVVNPGLARELLNTVVSLGGFAARLSPGCEVKASVSHELFVRLLADSFCLLTPLAIVFSMVSDRRSWLDESPVAHALQSEAETGLVLLDDSLRHVCFCSALGTGFVALIVQGALALLSPVPAGPASLGGSNFAFEPRAFAFLTQSRPPLPMPPPPFLLPWPGLNGRPSPFMPAPGVPVAGPEVYTQYAHMAPPPGPVLPTGGASLGEGSLRRLEDAGEKSLAALRMRALQVNDQNSKSASAASKFRGVAHAGSSLRQHLAALTNVAPSGGGGADRTTSRSQQEDEGYQTSI